MDLTNSGPTDRTFFIGVDLGQRESHSAIIILERFDQRPTFERILAGDGLTRRYVVRQAERVPLGTPYTEVVKRLKAIVSRLTPLGLCILVVDGTGIGIPIVELMKEESIGCRIQAITITSGQAAGPMSAPRATLITKMQVMAQRGELEIAEGCRESAALKRELAHLTLERSKGERDDLCLALALACWRAKVR